MILEKIVKFAKVASTNKYIPIEYTFAGVAAGLALYDGKISSIDAANLLITGTAIALLTFSAVKEQEIYKDVERFCKDHGFTESLMINNSFRKKAKIYAAESGRMNEFEKMQKFLYNMGKLN